MAFGFLKADGSFFLTFEKRPAFSAVSLVKAESFTAVLVFSEKLLYNKLNRSHFKKRCART